MGRPWDKGAEDCGTCGVRVAGGSLPCFSPDDIQVMCTLRI